MIQSNFPAPAWLDLKTFAPQPFESPEGEIRTVEIGPRALCYVPPYWIHRSVNTGPDELVMTFAYPADSGQDYAIIEEAGGMKSRVVDDGKGG